MLDNFLNIEYKDINAYLFDGLYISKSEYYKNLSSRPVINVSFKELEANNYEDIYDMYKTIIHKVDYVHNLTWLLFFAYVELSVMWNFIKRSPKIKTSQ